MGKQVYAAQPEAWHGLANAIIEQAIADYRNWQNQLQDSPFADRVWLTDALERLRDFFLGDWFRVLTDIDGYDLLCRLDQERES